MMGRPIQCTRLCHRQMVLHSEVRTAGVVPAGIIRSVHPAELSRNPRRTSKQARREGGSAPVHRLLGAKVAALVGRVHKLLV